MILDNSKIQPKLYSMVKFEFWHYTGLNLNFGNSEIQPKFYSMVKFIWKTTKMKTLTISPCCAILKSNQNCTPIQRISRFSKQLSQSSFTFGSSRPLGLVIEGFPILFATTQSLAHTTRLKQDSTFSVK